MAVVEGPPPYTPGFGIVPEVIAGRSEQLRQHEAALLRGARDPYFTQAIIGERGVGKTVFLSVLAERMHDQHGWIVVRYQARQDAEAIDEVLAELPDAAGRAWPGRGLRGLRRELTVEINAAVVKVQGRVAASPEDRQRSPATALQRALRVLGERASKRTSGVLIAIDEAQTLSAVALGDFGMIAQTVAHGERHPVAITLAGTPDLAGLLLRSGSFLERMPRTELAMLSSDEARLALLEPANMRGVTWDENALNLVSNAAGGYPYFVQLGGYHAWDHARGHDRIGGQDALHAARAIQTDADRMFRDRWARLGPAQREYLIAAAVAQLELPGLTAVPTGEIAARLGKRHSELTRVRATLINDHHLLRAIGRGELEFALPRFAVWLQDQVAPQTPPGGEKAVANPEFMRYVRDVRTLADAGEAAPRSRAAQPKPPPSTRDTSPRPGEHDRLKPREPTRPREKRRRP